MKAQNWDDLRVFLAVAREGTLSAAARAVDVHHSTISRRVAELEARLGARLFDRLPRGYRLTGAGESLLTRVTRIEEDVLAIGRQVSGADAALSGVVTLTTVGDLTPWLAGQLCTFRERYPAIEVEVLSDQRVFSLTRREADLALRPGPAPTEPDVVGQRACRMRITLYAAHRYLERFGAPSSPSDLAEHALVGFDDANAGLAFNTWLLGLAPGLRAALRGSDVRTQVDLIRAGLGVGPIPCILGDTIPELTRLELSPAPLWTDLWVLYHADLRQTARVRVFREFLLQALTGDADRFEGLS